MLGECGAFTDISKHQNRSQNQAEFINLETTRVLTNQRAPYLKAASRKRQKLHLFFLTSALSPPTFSLQQ